MKLAFKFLMYSITPCLGGFIMGAYFISDIPTAKAAIAGLAVGTISVFIVALGEKE